MTQEEFDRANWILNELQSLKSQLELWLGSKCVSEIRLGRMGIAFCRYVNFDKLKTDTVSSIESRIDELEREFASL